MSGFEVWVADCHLRRVEGGEACNCQAAVWADSYDSFRAVLAQHIESRGLKIVRLEECRPAFDYIGCNPGLQQRISRLARVVHSLNRVALSNIGEPGNCLAIVEHKFAPLPEQTAIPFGDREWIVPELRELLFGQAGGGPPLRTYLIADAALRKSITGVFDLDIVDVPISCLFKGGAAEELKEVAPYLIDMTLPEGAWYDKGKVPDFHKGFFDLHWAQGTGIFVRTTAPMTEVWKHFRRFPRMLVEADERWVFFRFWDPCMAPNYFDSIKDIPGKCAQWVNMRGGEHIACFIGNQTDCDQVWCITPIRSQLEGFSRNGQPVLSDIEMQGFARYKLERFVTSAHAWIIKNYSDFYRKNDDLKSFIRGQIQELQERDIKSEYAILYIIAGCFLLRMNVMQLPGDFQNILELEKTSEKERSELFLTAVLNYVERNSG